MKIFSTTFMLFVLAISTTAQSYQVNTFQSEYDSLVDFKSVTLEMGFAGESPYSWTKEFELDFVFPYFGEPYNSIIMDSDAVGSMPESDIFDLYLFGAAYTVADIQDTVYLPSEVRYKLTTKDDLKALVIEYHNVYNLYEYDDLGATHFINFQLWFYENGTIEVHFGEIDLENCSHYFPGEGFSFDNVDPTGEIFGPWVTIEKSDGSESACLFSDYSNPDIAYGDISNCGVLTSIPPEGSVIQFLPSDLSSTQEINDDFSRNNYSITSINNQIEIKGDLGDFRSCTLFDMNGRKILHSNSAQFPDNIYGNHVLIARINSKNGIETHKVLIANY